MLTSLPQASKFDVKIVTEGNNLRFIKLGIKLCSSFQTGGWLLNMLWMLNAQSALSRKGASLQFRRQSKALERTRGLTQVSQPATLPTPSLYPSTGWCWRATTFTVSSYLSYCARIWGAPFPKWGIASWYVPTSPASPSPNAHLCHSGW